MTKELFLKIMEEYSDKDTAEVLEQISEAAPDDFSGLVEATTEELEKQVLRPWAVQVKNYLEMSAREVMQEYSEEYPEDENLIN